MPTTHEIAWLAGLLEGEGSFGYYNGCPTIQVQMCDRDVVARAASVLGVSLRAEYKPRGRDTYKPVSGCVATGQRAVSWMMTLYALLGERRRTKVRDILTLWHASKRLPRIARNVHRMARCHPDRYVAGHWLCKECYAAQYRAAHRAAKRKEGAIA